MSLDKDRAIFAAVSTWLQTTVGFKLIAKQKSPFMWVLYVISFMFLWNRKFMTEYTTTIFGRVYVPEGYVEEKPGDAWRTLCHEGRHRFDAGTHGEGAFSLSYLWPQLVLLPVAVVLGLIFLPWWGTVLVSASTLAPWPAHWRAEWERNGYLASIIVDIMRGWNVEGNVTGPDGKAITYVEYMVTHYCGWGYYRMVWGHGRAEARVREDIERAKRLISGAENDPYYTSMIATLRNAGV